MHLSHSSTQTLRRPNHKKRNIILLAAILLLVLIPTTALAYVGFVPGVTELMQTNKPIDLGVNYNAVDFQNFQKHTLTTVSNFHGGTVSPGPKLVISGANTVEATVSQEELTAFVNMVPWTGSPLSNSQIRLSNGTFEFSGNIRSAYVSDFMHSLYPGGDNGQVNPVFKLASYLHNPAVYIKANISAVNVTGGPAHGLLSLKIVALKVNRTDLSDKVGNISQVNVTVPEGSYEKGIPYSLSSLSAANGRLTLYGTIPSVFSVGNGDPSTICDNYHGGSLVSLDAIDGHIGSANKYCD